MASTNSSTTDQVPFGWHLFFNDKCYSTVVGDMDVLDGECLQLLASRIISYIIIIITALFVKLPQIFKILKSESVEGISFISQIFILITSSSNVTYSVAKDYPPSTWFESGILALQILIIAILIKLYSDNLWGAVVLIVVYLTSMLFLLSPLASMGLHVSMQLLSVPFVAFSKLIQIWTNIKNSSTGQLSATSIYMQNFRSFGRLFSTITELGDPLRILVYAQASLLNVVLSAQMYYYTQPKDGGKNEIQGETKKEV